jgi:hypothetical protein
LAQAQCALLRHKPAAAIPETIDVIAFNIRGRQSIHLCGKTLTPTGSTTLLQALGTW